MKRIIKETDLFQKEKPKIDCEKILAKIEEKKKVRQELDSILSALRLEAIFPKSKKVSNIVSDLKKGDFIIKRGSKTMGEVIDADGESLTIKVGDKTFKCWRQECKKVI